MTERNESNDWSDDLFESEPWAKAHAKLKRHEQTLKEIDFIKKVAPAKDRLSILDMPCGLARHSLELLREGHSVFGIDRSQNLLRLARENAKAAGLDLRCDQGDMRSFKRAEAFDVVLTLWGSLGYFSDDETLQMFRNIHESLKPGGVFLFDQPVLDSFLRGGFSQSHWTELDGFYLLERTNWKSETGLNESEWVFIENGKSASYKSSIRIFTHRELCGMLKAAGFSRVDSYGSLELKPFAIGDRLYCAAYK